jgi:AraC-like DNA-binding protein
MEIIASFFKRYDIKLPERFKKDIRRFEAIASLVEDSPGNKWSIQELAAKSGFGRVRFSTEFKRVFGVPPAKFIMRKRLERARYLLLATGRTLEDIAEELGFSDAFHLSKSFKADTGLSPKEFRKSRHINQP